MLNIKQLMPVTKLFMMIAASIIMTGCVDYFESNNHVEYPPSYPRDYVPPPKKNGTIYQSGYEVSLYQDRIAYHIGDILTVKLEEQTQGQKKTKTKTSKAATNDFDISKAFGLNISAGSALATNSDMEFNGTGESNQQNALNGTISVTVTRVLSNGSLVVSGESWVTINTGREYIQLTGLVRREDIDPDNVVSSQRVANARITYSANGQVANATRGGIITQFFTKFWPY